MKKIITLLFLISTYLSFSQSKSIDSVKEKITEISSEYKSYDILKCQSIQATLLYKNPETYSFILGKIKHKEFQTFKYKSDKGSILYFEFDENTEKAKGFIEGLLWGGDKPTKSHPEKIIINNKLMIVVSFPLKSKIRKEILKTLHKISS
ncbi:MAG: hypothetical protein AB8B78_05665 [Polaribacter sp.]